MRYFIEFNLFADHVGTIQSGDKCMIVNTDLTVTGGTTGCTLFYFIADGSNVIIRKLQIANRNFALKFDGTSAGKLNYELHCLL